MKKIDKNLKIIYCSSLKPDYWIYEISEFNPYRRIYYALDFSFIIKLKFKVYPVIEEETTSDQLEEKEFTYEYKDDDDDAKDDTYIKKEKRIAKNNDNDNNKDLEERIKRRHLQRNLNTKNLKSVLVNTKGRLNINQSSALIVSIRYFYYQDEYQHKMNDDDIEKIQIIVMLKIIDVYQKKVIISDFSSDLHIQQKIFTSLKHMNAIYDHLLDQLMDIKSHLKNFTWLDYEMKLVSKDKVLKRVYKVC